MNDDDYFLKYVPRRIAEAINDYCGALECCGQDAYEVLVMTFGDNVCGRDLKNATDESFVTFAHSMKEYFELDSVPKTEDAKTIISNALAVWGG